MPIWHWVPHDPQPIRWDQASKHYRSITDWDRRCAEECTREAGHDIGKSQQGTSATKEGADNKRESTFSEQFLAKWKAPRHSKRSQGRGPKHTGQRERQRVWASARRTPLVVKEAEGGIEKHLIWSNATDGGEGNHLGVHRLAIGVTEAIMTEINKIFWFWIVKYFWIWLKIVL